MKSGSASHGMRPTHTHTHTYTQIHTQSSKPEARGIMRDVNPASVHWRVSAGTFRACASRRLCLPPAHTQPAASSVLEQAGKKSDGDNSGFISGRIQKQRIQKRFVFTAKLQPHAWLFNWNVGAGWTVTDVSGSHVLLDLLSVTRLRIRTEVSVVIRDHLLPHPRNVSPPRWHQQSSWEGADGASHFSPPSAGLRLTLYCDPEKQWTFQSFSHFLLALTGRNPHGLRYTRGPHEHRVELSHRWQKGAQSEFMLASYFYSTEWKQSINESTLSTGCSLGDRSIHVQAH